MCVTKYGWQGINESKGRTVDEIRLDQLVEESRETERRREALAEHSGEKACMAEKKGNKRRKQEDGSADIS